MEAIAGIDLSTAGSPSLIMRDLSEYSTLPFLAAFDVIVAPTGTKTQKRITYIALSKKTMPMLVDLFFKFRNDPAIYVDGTLEAVLSVSDKELSASLHSLKSDISLGLFDTSQAKIRLSSAIQVRE